MVSDKKRPYLTVAAALRFVKTCLHTNNHFIHRNFAKNGVTKGLLDIVERETDRDTMLSSACVDALELIRKVRTTVASHPDPLRTT
jgi:protein phosphatase-4 regulatory subunit 3